MGHPLSLRAQAEAAPPGQNTRFNLKICPNKCANISNKKAKVREIRNPSTRTSSAKAFSKIRDGSEVNKKVNCSNALKFFLLFQEKSLETLLNRKLWDRGMGLLHSDARSALQ